MTMDVKASQPEPQLQKFLLQTASLEPRLHGSCKVLTPEAMQVEDVTAGQLLVPGGWRHLLTTDDADVVAALKILSCGVRESLIHVDCYTPARKQYAVVTAAKDGKTGAKLGLLTPSLDNRLKTQLHMKFCQAGLAC